MRKTGPFTIHSFKIPFKVGERVTLVPFGDVHRSTKRCSEEKWKEFCYNMSSRIALGENLYLLGMGDYDDFMSAGERIKIQNAELHETTEEKIDEVLDRHVNILCKELEFAKGRILGLLEGNHYGRFFKTGITTTQKMCERLDSVYLGGSSMFSLSFCIPPDKRMRVDVFAHHGLGAGTTGGSSINSVERMANVAEADIYLMAHDHKKWGFKTSRLRLTHGGNVDLQDRQLVMARTGSFLKAYEPGTHGYVAEKCMRPSDIGHVEIYIKPMRTKIGSEDHKERLKVELEVLI
jgi:hypothetical protein